MAEIIQVPNFDVINIIEKAVLDADADAGQPTITLLNVQAISANKRVYVGDKGSENGEILTVLSISGKNVTFTTNLTNKHKKFEPAYVLFGDQVRLYKADDVDGSTPDDAQFSLVTSDNIDPDQMWTFVTDSTGGSDFWYKTSYYNSISSDETSLTQSIAQRGGGYGHYVSVEDIRDESGLSNAPIDDSRIAARRDRAESEVNGICAGAGYALPLQDGNGTLCVPDVIQNITLMLASGFMLMSQFSVESDTYKSGKDKVDDARKLLKSIGKREMTLVDGRGRPLVASLTVDGFPDENTGVDSNNPEPAKFTMNQKF